MKTSLTHLPEHKQAELKAIVAALVPKYAEVEMIILYGSYARGNWVEDKYVENGNTYEYKSDYDLLIITSTNGKANVDSFLQRVSLWLLMSVPFITMVSVMENRWCFSLTLI